MHSWEFLLMHEIEKKSATFVSQEFLKWNVAVDGSASVPGRLESFTGREQR